MKLTKEKAIEYTIELWTFLAETGKDKEGWDGWKKYGESLHTCPLCDYVNSVDEGGGCLKLCPYAQKFGHCCDTSSPYGKWEDVRTPKTRRKYAKLFLEQLKQL